MSNISERNEAWKAYLRKLIKMTERDEARIERAFVAGWIARGACEAETAALAKRIAR